MAIEYREKRIGPHVYRVTQHGTRAGLKLLVRITKIAGPGVGSFVGGVGRGDELGSALANGVGEALHDLASRLREDEVDAIATEFAGQTVVALSAELQPRLVDIFDDHFAGHYDLLLQWLQFCLEVNYGTFFGGASGGGPLRKLWTILSTLQSQKASTGTSTESPPAIDTKAA